jgi:N-acetyl-anhydromuramyl-L-alanine amidase AmpD
VRPINRIVVHCSASQPDPKIDEKTIDRWHRQRGFREIGYHYVILANGELRVGRPVTEVGAHASGHNKDSIGICMIGGVDAKGRSACNFTSAQFKALRELIVNLRVSWPRATVLGHRDLSPDRNGDGRITSQEWLKDCPCFDVREWMREVDIA